MESAYEECGDFGDGAEKYYNGFIDGCLSAEIPEKLVRHLQMNNLILIAIIPLS